MHPLRPLVALLSLAVAPCAAAQIASVDTFVRGEMRKHHIPGLVVLVARDGRVVQQSSYGEASVEFHVPTSPATVFEIASASKSITAVALMRLVEAGKLRVTDSVGRLLPNMPATWGGVTVRHLLTHTSGLPDVLARAGYGPVMFTSREQALDSLPKLPLPFAPGERWAYNQTNYLLLQEIIARTSGMPYVRFVQSEIFDPLGMRATVFDGRAVVANHATHYGADSSGHLLRRINDATTIPFLYSAGGVNTSASDLLAFAEALRTHRILSERSVEQMWTPVTLNDGTSKITVAPNFSIEYGYGFLLDSRAGHRSAGHSGGGTAAFRVFPDDHVSVVVLHNGQGPDPDALLMGIASRWIPALR